MFPFGRAIYLKTKWLSSLVYLLDTCSIYVSDRLISHCLVSRLSLDTERIVLQIYLQEHRDIPISGNTKTLVRVFVGERVWVIRMVTWTDRKQMWPFIFNGLIFPRVTWLDFQHPKSQSHGGVNSRIHRQTRQSMSVEHHAKTTNVKFNLDITQAKG